MAGRMLLKAICLALILIICFAPNAWTEPPGGYTPGSTPTNGGGEGHPWDDGTVEDNPNDSTGVSQPVEVADQPIIVPVAPIGPETSGAFVLRGMMHSLWRKLVASEVSVIRNSSKLKSLR